MPEGSTLLLPLALMLLLGVPHGAYDGPLLWRYSAARSCLPLWLAGYLLLAVGAFLFWQWQHEVAFPLFLTLSLIHFGRSDALAAALPASPLAVAGFGGMFTVLLPWWHRDGVQAVLDLLQVPYARFFVALDAVLLLWLPAAGATLVNLLRARRHRALLTVLALVAAVLVLPPLWALCIYFCGQHARHHTHWVRRLLQDDAGARRQLQAILLATLLLGLGCLWLLRDGIALSAALAHTFFAGLFALTVPHMVLVDWWLPRLIVRVSGPAPPHGVLPPERSR